MMFQEKILLIKTRLSARTIKQTKKLSPRILATILIVTLLSLAGLIGSPAGAKTSPQPPPILTPQITASNFPGSSWQTATPQEVGMDPTKFAAAMNLLPSPSIVIRNGRIVGQKGDIARTGYVWSASKSMVALIFARLLQQGRISGYDVVVPGSNNPSDPAATFRQFLSMTSDYHLSPHSPGNHYAYNNGAVHFYGKYLQNTFYPGRSEVQMLQDAFVSNLGFQDSLGYNTSGYLSGWDGGWSMSTRDMARIAYLVLRDGNWNGQQLVPSSF